VEWECNTLFVLTKFKNPNGSNTFGVFFVLKNNYHLVIWLHSDLIFVRSSVRK